MGNYDTTVESHALKEYAVYERLWWEHWVVPVLFIACFGFGLGAIFVLLQNSNLQTEVSILREQLAQRDAATSTSLSAEQNVQVTITDLEEVNLLTTEVQTLVNMFNQGGLRLEPGLIFEVSGIQVVVVPDTEVQGAIFDFDGACMLGIYSGSCHIEGELFGSTVIADQIIFTPVEDGLVAEANEEVTLEATSEVTAEATEGAENGSVATELPVESSATAAASQTAIAPTEVTQATLVVSPTAFPTLEATNTPVLVVASPTFVQTQTEVGYLPYSPLCPVEAESLVTEPEAGFEGYFEEWIEGIFATNETVGDGCIRITSLNNEVGGYEFGFHVYGQRNRNSRWQWVPGEYVSIPGNQILAYTYAPDSHDPNGGYYLIAFGTEPRSSQININVVVVSARTGRVLGTPGFSGLDVGEYHFHVEESMGSNAIFLRHNDGGTELFTTINGTPQTTLNWETREWQPE